MMPHEKANPAARSGAHRVDAINSFAAVDLVISIAKKPSYQVAIVAAKYRLTPLMARIVCDLADIGARVDR
jgi:hypothetical protein